MLNTGYMPALRCYPTLSATFSSAFMRLKATNVTSHILILINYFLTDLLGCWIEYRTFDKKYELAAYELMSANDAPERDPMDWYDP